MKTWGQFAAEEPESAELGRKVLGHYGIAYLGTLRADGTPRITPVSPVIVGDGLYLGIMPSSPKCLDLERDPRCTIHGLPGPNDAEFCVTGTVVRLDPDQVEKLIRDAPPHVRIARDTNLYELRLASAGRTYFRDPGDGARPEPARSRWQAESDAR